MDLKLFKKKGIIGRGLSITPQCVRLAQVKEEQGRIKILSLHETPLTSTDPEEVRRAFESMGISKRAGFAVNLQHPSFRMKKVRLPPMPAAEIEQALRWKLLEDVENGQEDYDVRYERLPSASSKSQEMEETHAYLAYGMSHRAVAETQKWYQIRNLKVEIGEPLAVSLAAWLQAVDPQPEKVRAVYFLQESDGLFLGVKGSSLLDSTPLSFEQNAEFRKGPEMLSTLRQNIEDFLLQHNLSGVDEVALAGEWEAADPEALGKSLGTPCFMMGAPRPESTVDPQEFPSEKVSRFAAELGLSTFPRGDA